MDRPTELRRTLPLAALVLYGLGTTIGAGIYALAGKVAGTAGMWAPLAFVLASVLAALTALSFAELSVRFPLSAGEAVYVEEGLGWPGLPTAVGLLVVLSGTVSAATITRGFGGYAAHLLGGPPEPAVVLLVVVMGLVAAWGVGWSVGLAAVLTVVEIGGLVWVTALAAPHLAELPARAGEFASLADAGVWRGLGLGAFLAFYAFLGFEDMVNVAEEVKDVRRNLPLAIGATLAISALLYALLVLVCVLAVPPAELAQTDAPLALVVERATGREPVVIGAVAGLALLNGALVQVIMASRVLYGLGRRHALPGALGRVHPRTRTPLLATGLVTAAVGALALLFPLQGLAEVTSGLTLVVFALVNLALLRIVRRGDPSPGLALPAWIPAAGFTVCVLFLTFRVWQAF